MSPPIRSRLPGVALCLWWAAGAVPAAPAEEFAQDFRGGGGYEKSFRPTGPGAPKAIRAEPQGLRITLAPDQREIYETIRATMHEKVTEGIAAHGVAQSHLLVLQALLKLG